MKPTLFVLAAGLGSRYGGLKQMDGLGPNQETIMEYSIYDAIRAGFGKVVFVIRRSFEADFMEFVQNRFGKEIAVEVVFQELDALPKGYKLDPIREKPWGTNHAVMMADGVIKEPFCVINADDFYGKEAFESIGQFLKGVVGQEKKYAMVGYRIGNTLSDSGSVSRGVCEKDDDNFLTKVVERTHIERVDGEARFKDEEGKWHALGENTPVSMNLWGFTPDYFKYSEKAFKKFLDAHGDKPKSEFFIPLVVNELVENKTVSVKVLDTPATWFGVTYKEDRADVVSKIEALIKKGVYPEALWK